MPSSQVLLQLVVFLLVLLGLAWPMGQWLAVVADGRLPKRMALFGKAEGALYRLAGIDPEESTTWKQ